MMAEKLLAEKAYFEKLVSPVDNEMTSAKNVEDGVSSTQTTHTLHPRSKPTRTNKTSSHYSIRIPNSLREFSRPTNTTLRGKSPASSPQRVVREGVHLPPIDSPTSKPTSARRPASAGRGTPGTSNRVSRPSSRDSRTNSDSPSDMKSSTSPPSDGKQANVRNVPQKQGLPSIAPPTSEDGDIQSLLPLEMFDEGEDRDPFLDKQLEIQKILPFVEQDENSNLPAMPEYESQAGVQRLKAFSRYFYVGIGQAWRPCTVLKYNETERKFLIRWDPDENEPAESTTKAQLTKYVRRLNLFFKGEDVDVFEGRIESAKKLRAQIEAQMRFHTYIESRPSEDIAPMPDDVSERIMGLTAVGVPGRFVPVVRSTLEEARKHYIYAKKCAIVLELLKKESTQKQLAPLHFMIPGITTPLDPPSLVTNREKWMPELFAEKYKKNPSLIQPFMGIRKVFIQHALYSRSNAVKAMHAIQAIWYHLKASDFVDLEVNKRLREQELAEKQKTPSVSGGEEGDQPKVQELDTLGTLEARDYLNHQQQHISSVTDLLLFTWIPTVTKALRDLVPNFEELLGLDTRKRRNISTPKTPDMIAGVPEGGSGQLKMVLYVDGDEIEKGKDPEEGLTSLLNSEEEGRLVHFRDSELGRLSKLADMIMREQVHGLIERSLLNYREMIVEGYRHYADLHFMHMKKLANDFLLALKERKKFYFEVFTADQYVTALQDVNMIRDKIAQQENKGMDALLAKQALKNKNTIAAPSEPSSGETTDRKKNDASGVATKTNTAPTTGRKVTEEQLEFPPHTSIFSPNFNPTLDDFIWIGSMLSRTNELIEYAHLYHDYSMEEKLIEKQRYEKMGMLLPPERSGSARKGLGSGRGSKTNTPRTPNSANVAFSDNNQPQTPSSIQTSNQQRPVIKGKDGLTRSQRRAQTEAASNETYQVPPPPGPIEPKMEESDSTDPVDEAIRQVSFVGKKAAFTDNLLQKVDPFYWSERTFIPFPCPAPPLILVALHLVEDGATFPDEPDHLHLSTLTFNTPRANETGTVGHHVEVVPAVEYVGMLASYTLCQMQVDAGNNIPKLESSFAAELSLPVLPTVPIARLNESFKVVRKEISDTVDLAMRPPLQVKSLYDALQEEVIDCMRHPQIKLKEHYMTTVEKRKQMELKLAELKKKGQWDVEDEKEESESEEEDEKNDDEEGGDNNKPKKESNKKKKKNEEDQDIIKFRIEGRDKIRGRQKKISKKSTASSANLPALKDGKGKAKAKGRGRPVPKKEEKKEESEEGSDNEGEKEEENPELFDYEDENGCFLGETPLESWTRHMKEEMKDIETELQRYENLIKRIEEITQDIVPCGLIAVNTVPIKEKLKGVVSKMLKDALEGIAKQININNEITLKRFQTLTDRAAKNPASVEDLFELLNEKDDSDKEIPHLEHEIMRSFAALELISKRMKVERHVITLLCQTQQAPSKMELVQEDQGLRLSGVRKELEEKHRSEMATFVESMDALSADVDSLVKFSRLSDTDEASQKVYGIKSRIDRCQQQAQVFNAHEKLFGWQETTFPTLAAIQRSFDPQYQLWSCAHQLSQNYEEWTEGPFLKLNPFDIEEKMNEWNKTAFRLIQKPFKDMSNPRGVAQAIRDKLDDFRPNLALIQALRREGMQERHWEEIAKQTQLPVKPTMEMTLNYLIDMGLPKFMEIIESVSATAASEYKLDRELSEMEEAWKLLDFQTIAHKDTKTYVLRAVDDIIQLLDDQLVSTQNMTGNPHIAILEPKRKLWEQLLVLVRDTLESWLRCQIAWMYLEPIFASPDIQHQLPNESKRFFAVDTMWRATMAKVVKTPRILPLLRREKNNMVLAFNNANKELDEVQKKLDLYLETKRAAFPRFYFLSDEDLLQILAKTKEPQAVQPHLRKCFEGINKLTFEGEGESCIVHSMISAEGEEIKFDKQVLAEGAVEQWLLNVEAMMRQSIRKQIQDSLTAYNQTPREQWVLKWPAQVVIAVNSIMWTRQVGEALKKGLNAVQNLEGKLSKQIEDIVHLVGSSGKSMEKDAGDEAGEPVDNAGEDGMEQEDGMDDPKMGVVNLTALNRTLLGALLTIDVHSRDSVSYLLQSQADFDSFEWTSQLRYYWIDGNVRVMQNAANLPYGYEYLGNTPRLVITPLTDRCYMTLTGALQMNLGGAPAGPAGTGKTETVKDLAKAIAKQCVVFNCQEGLNIDAMSNFFKGLAMNGAWSCFDEFNRIDIEVLSVVAQQISCIQEAVRGKQTNFNFQGSEISLDPSYAVFITMNPGYAGRTELPDNLKALFRPMSMMIPDYALISEISLFSCGFTKGRVLAQKMVATFQLCSEQLSSQDHYDFGMRAVKTVLNAAANLKRAAGPDDTEDELVLRALKDSNVPKFLNEDLPLFDGIIGDLFPGVKLPNPDYKNLHTAVVDAAKEFNLQPVDALIFKCTQMFETTNVRHGKTQVSKVLQRAMTLLSQRGVPDFVPVHMHKLNPKSITIGQLYGVFDERSHEWSNGILARVVRDCAIDESGDLHWIVCDGPVDALWIENMNTVLDDNKKLCLPNREVIIFTEQMKMMFEVADLSQASPATVSRSGMVYMQPTTLGWKPLVVSWLQILHQKLNPMSFGEKQADYKKRCDTTLKLLTCEAEMKQKLEAKLGSTATLPALEKQKSVNSLELAKMTKTGTMAALQLKHFFQTKLLGLFEWLVPSMLDYVAHHCHEQLPVEEHGKVNGICTLFESIFSELIKDEDEAAMTQASLTVWLECGFLFSLIWSMGGTILGSEREAFSEYLRGLLMGGGEEKDQHPNFVKFQKPLPDTGSVFDFVFDKKTNNWVPFNSIAPSFSIPDDAQFHEVIVPTTDSIRATFLLNVLLNHGVPAMFGGSTGTGKTATIKSHVESLEARTWEPLFINFSAQTSANQTQDMIDAKLMQRRTNLFGPPGGKRLVTFVDDLNMPAPEKYKAQPPLELLRQLIDQHGWYNRKDLVFKTIVDVNLIGAVAPPGGGRTQVEPRLAVKFARFVMPDMDNTTLTQIFQTLNGWILSHMPSSMRRMNETIVEAATHIYFTISENLRPTPAKSHYTFNLRDLSKVFQGIAQAGLGGSADDNNPVIADQDQLVRLVLHECDRVFGDRLMGVEDKTWFRKMLGETSTTYFKKDYEEILKSRDGNVIIFGDFENNGRYEEITSIQQLHQTLLESLDGYNSLHNSAPMNLVLFTQAIQHVARILRVVRTPKGHCLLIGVGGSGRKSLAQLATHIADYLMHQIRPTKGYGWAEWREDIKTLLLRTGRDEKDMVFLISDDQIKEDSWIEDISGILNTGTVPNIFEKDEQEELIQTLTPLAQQVGKASSPAAVYNFFADRCQQHIRIIVAMSPLGESFRNRLRMFPSLINCTTVDVFEEWSQDALDAVSKQYFMEGDGLGAFDLEFLMKLANGEIRSEADKDKPPSTSPKIDEEDVMNKIASFLVKVHQHIQQKAKQFMNEERRVYHITPTSFLNFLKITSSVIREKRQGIIGTKKRYIGGLDVLKKTEESVKGMQDELEEMVPIRKQFHQETMDLMKTIEVDQKVASENKNQVEAEEKIVLEQESEAKALSDDCEEQLNAALPALNRAKEMVAKLDKKMIDEMKQMKHPPSGVKLVMEAICVMKSVKATPVRNASGRTEMDYWESSKKVLADSKFVNWVFQFNAEEQLTDEIVKNMQPYLKNPDFVPEIVKNHSAAAANLCGWAHAIVDYYEKIKIVKPKKAALEQAKITLADLKARLQEKRDVLTQIEANLKSLMEKYDAAVEKRDKLAEQVAQYEKKLGLAKAVITGLGGEKSRWQAEAKAQDEKMITLTGDVLLSAASLAYFGAFTMKYRTDVTKFIKQEMGTISFLPCSATAGLIETLGVPVTIRQWQIASLPNDNFSTENGIIGTYGQQWPLFIDPQGQANKWIKTLEKGPNFRVFRPDAKLVQNIEAAVRYGWTVLIEGVTESIDSALYPLLSKAVYRSKGQLLVRLGDSDVEYDPKFKLYLTTKYPNPNYPPEISTKVCLVNFTLTPAGMEDQLLGMVIQSEMPAMEEQRNKLIVENAEALAQKQAAEDGILEMLTEPNVDLLADATLVDKLRDSKDLSTSLDMKMAENAKIQQKNNESRKAYTPIASHGSALFFCIADLRNIDPMYQYSLTWFIGLFTQTLANEPPNSDQADKILSIIDHLTEVIYDNVCRSLFQEHKIFFAFLLAMTIEQLHGKIDRAERSFLANGPSTLTTRHQNPDPTWITERLWRDISGICELKVFEDLDTNFVKRLGVWKKWMQTGNEPEQQKPKPGSVSGTATPNVPGQGQQPSGDAGSAGQPGPDGEAPKEGEEDETLASAEFKIPPLPRPYSEKASPIARLCLLRVLHPDWLPYAITDYVKTHLGERFTTPPPFDLQAAYLDSNNVTPIVFVLSAGADPQQILKDFSVQMKKKDKMFTLSLGQNQDVPATKLLREGQERGNWVFLQNCHLYPSWMPAMEELLEATNPATTHPDFRVWLTSMPTPTFPVSVLQNAVKMTNEPPIGVRANLQRAFLRYSDDFVEGPGAPVHWQRLLYNLTYFHALVLERRQFGPLGFNIPYEFNESDLLICEQQLEMFLKQTVDKYKLTAVNDNEASDEPIESSTQRPLSSTSNATGRKGQFSSRPTIQKAKKGTKKGGPAVVVKEEIAAPTMKQVSSEVIQQINALIPWKALRYITGEVNYGGRVTDDWDRRTLLSLLDELYTPEALEKEDFKLNGIPAPPFKNTPFTKDQFLKYIDDSLETRDPPELFGLHKNAGLTLLRRQAQSSLSWLVQLQPGMTGSGEDSNAKVIGLANDILSQLPPQNFDIEAIREKYPTKHDECMNTVITQDLVRYNKLLKTMRSTLTETINALKGLVVLSSQCEQIALNLTAGLVPEAWAPVSYPSLKPIGSWVSDLKLRLDFMQNWVDNGPPPVFPLPFFFFPQAFLTGTLQNWARSRHIPIDLIEFGHVIVEADPTTITSPPANGDGCYITGLFMEGARWDPTTHTIGESEPGELMTSVPVIWLKPKEKEKKIADDGKAFGKKNEIGGEPIPDSAPEGIVRDLGKTLYSCPCYKISTRAGVLSTTGHSTNYVLTLKLPSNVKESHWVKRGVALLCQPD
ncbi:putative Dynein axonemal heavy chain 5 [Blattamonas nauphoetae]|uniref:Dynein axonemal heavy chain 5 n=1 Tax=Blattamonas nauphoetae TaxID=2049346 RepID=A0ABQ9XX96_9EUKA|nr:putative Dynein axonemal heavy chain 5 [Blattamonas nauphoetae]